MAGSERSGIICIPFETGVTVDVEKTGNGIVGVVWSISEVKPEFRDIDLAISIGFPETYDTWLNNSKQFQNNIR